MVRNFPRLQKEYTSNDYSPVQVVYDIDRD